MGDGDTVFAGFPGGGCKAEEGWVAVGCGAGFDAGVCGGCAEGGRVGL